MRRWRLTRNSHVFPILLTILTAVLDEAAQIQITPPF